MTVGLLTLALLPAYICRLAALNVREDPWWETLGTYTLFACAIMAGSASMMDNLQAWHVAAVILGLLWILGTYHRWADRAYARSTC